jgi:hypothetical protein
LADRPLTTICSFAGSVPKQEIAAWRPGVTDRGRNPAVSDRHGRTRGNAGVRTRSAALIEDVAIVIALYYMAS